MFETADRLREITLGSWDGLYREDIEARSPGMFETYGRTTGISIRWTANAIMRFTRASVLFLDDALARPKLIIVAMAW